MPNALLAFFALKQYRTPYQGKLPPTFSIPTSVEAIKTPPPSDMPTNKFNLYNHSLRLSPGDSVLCQVDKLSPYPQSPTCKVQTYYRRKDHALSIINFGILGASFLKTSLSSSPMWQLSMLSSTVIMVITLAFLLFKEQLQNIILWGTSKNIFSSKIQLKHKEFIGLVGRQLFCSNFDIEKVVSVSWFPILGFDTCWVTWIWSLRLFGNFLLHWMRGGVHCITAYE